MEQKHQQVYNWLYLIYFCFNKISILLVYYIIENNYLDTGFEDPVSELYDDPELESPTNFSKKSFPSIRTDKSPNVVAVLGKEVSLACYVDNLGNRTVSCASS